jgi:hypothetical protein
MTTETLYFYLKKKQREVPSTQKAAVVTHLRPDLAKVLRSLVPGCTGVVVDGDPYHRVKVR